MEFNLRGNVLEFDKVLSDLDRFVFDFVELLNDLGIRYVVISGYISIILGRTRTTEDVDMFVERMDLGTYKKFYNELEKKGYWIINASDMEEPFGMLEDNLSIRVARKGKAIPNFEIKFPKKDTDFDSLEHPLKMKIGDRMLLTSKLETQIAFKLWLGSDKDIEDAVHVSELFKDKLDKRLLKDIGKKLKVGEEMKKYGIV